MQGAGLPIGRRVLLLQALSGSFLPITYLLTPGQLTSTQAGPPATQPRGEVARHHNTLIGLL
ncbi:MAG TPA: hypothetical protein DGT23_08605 [Micromonosporaceae bacterium]|nr:hypothetical protein [Micromonosporaceae bacterium]